MKYPRARRLCTSESDCQAGSQGGGGGQFNRPKGVTTDADGYVYVADSGNRRIQVFSEAGDFLRTWGWGEEVGGGPAVVGWEEAADLANPP